MCLGFWIGTFGLGLWLRCSDLLGGFGVCLVWVWWYYGLAAGLFLGWCSVFGCLVGGLVLVGGGVLVVGGFGGSGGLDVGSVGFCFMVVELVVLAGILA